MDWKFVAVNGNGSATLCENLRTTLLCLQMDYKLLQMDVQNRMLRKKTATKSTEWFWLNIWVFESFVQCRCHPNTKSRCTMYYVTYQWKRYRIFVWIELRMLKLPLLSQNNIFFIVSNLKRLLVGTGKEEENIYIEAKDQTFNKTCKEKF